MDRARSPRSSQPESYLGSTFSFRGELEGEGVLRLDSQFEGNVSVRGTLHVGPGAAVRADRIEADDISIEGDVEARIVARNTVRILRGAKVVGDVEAYEFVLDEGADFQGQVDGDVELPEELRRVDAPRRDGRVELRDPAPPRR